MTEKRLEELREFASEKQAYGSFTCIYRELIAEVTRLRAALDARDAEIKALKEESQKWRIAFSDSSDILNRGGYIDAD